MGIAGLDPSEWERLSRILDAALELPLAERSRYLDEACGGHESLRLAAEAVLAADAARGGILDSPLSIPDELRREPPPRGEDDPPSDTLPAEPIGPFRVLRELGRGGMAVVYLAERVDGAFEQRVAIKVIKRGLDTDEVLARFVLERNILARLEHPNIARLIDGGVTADGLPYFAMEAVDGEPITDHLAGRDASLYEVLELFVHVGRVVQFAHERFVVHRDLKPSNIMVSRMATVKLLDFGISKLLDPGGDARTRTLSRRLTPLYAAPEQWTGEPATAATDVYSLGVLLYELLTGVVPGERPDGEAERAPRTEPLPVSQVAERAAPGTRQARWAKRVRGDLDRIVAQAMDTTPARRYPSAAALIEDVERFVAGEPVRATRPTLAYRARRFIGRHRLGVSVSAVALLSLLVGLGATVWQMGIAARERDRARAEASRAETINRFMLDLFRSVDPDSAKGRTLTARDLLDQGGSRIEAELKGQPALEATLLTALGGLYRQISALDQATVMYERALAIEQRLTGPESAETAAAMADLGAALGEHGDYDRALQLLGRARAIQTARLGPDHADLAMTLSRTATVYQAMGRYGDAETLGRRSLAITERSLGADHPRVADELDHLGTLFYSERRLDDAAPLHERALAIRLRAYGRDNLATATSMENVANLAGERGQLARAESLHLGALAIVRKLYGPDHFLTINILKNLAGHYLACERWERAEPLAWEALRVARLNYGPNHPLTAHMEHNAGSLQASLGRFGRAESLIQDAQRIWRRTLGTDYVIALYSRNSLGEIYLQQGRLREAEELLLTTRERMVHALGPENFQLGYSMLAIGRLRMAQGRYGEAENEFRKAADLWARSFGPDHFRNAEALADLAGSWYEQGSVEAACATYERAVRLFESRLERGANPCTGAYVGWGRALLRLGRGTQADSVLRIVVAARWKNPDQWSARMAEADAALGVCLSRTGSASASERLLRRSLPILRTDPVAPRSLVRDAENAMRRFRGGLKGPGV